jgi:hypothetical protein
MAVPIVAVILGVIFLLLVSAEAGIWGWILFGIGAFLALAFVVLLVGRHHQHPSDLDAPITRAPSRGDRLRVLVVSDGSATSSAFVDEVVSRGSGRSLDVLVVAPALGSRLSHWTGDDQARHDAEGRLEQTVSALTAAGVSARGEVASDDPIQAADDALREFPADEIILATRPEQEANWKERGVVETAQSRYGLPVSHVAVDV